MSITPTRQKKITDYLLRLAQVKAQPHHQNKEIGDQWRTPDWLFYGIDAWLGKRIRLDLFTDGLLNTKCKHFYTAADNALVQDWAADLFDLGDDAMAYGNPPYSIATSEDGVPVTGMVNIMQKAMIERNLGAKQVYVVKSATSETWWPAVAVNLAEQCEAAGIDISEMPRADRVYHIQGRISFERPSWFVPGPNCPKAVGAGFGATILIFDKTLPPVDGDRYIQRDFLKALGDARLVEIQHELDAAMAEDDI